MTLYDFYLFKIQEDKPIVEISPPEEEELFRIIYTLQHYIIMDIVKMLLFDKIWNKCGIVKMLLFDTIWNKCRVIYEKQLLFFVWMHLLNKLAYFKSVDERI